jgi:hypothetical protein
MSHVRKIIVFFDGEVVGIPVTSIYWIWRQRMLGIAVRRGKGVVTEFEYDAYAVED